jgi:hypothetical protein
VAVVNAQAVTRECRQPQFMLDVVDSKGEEYNMVLDWTRPMINSLLHDGTPLLIVAGHANLHYDAVLENQVAQLLCQVRNSDARCAEAARK